MCVGFTAVCVVAVGLVLVLFRVLLMDPEGACLAPAFFLSIGLGGTGALRRMGFG